MNREEFLKKCQDIEVSKRQIECCNKATELKLRILDLKFKMKSRELDNRFSIQVDLMRRKIEELATSQKEKKQLFSADYERLVQDYLDDVMRLKSAADTKCLKEKLQNEDLKQTNTKLQEEIEHKIQRIELYQKECLLDEETNLATNLTAIKQTHSFEMKQLELELNSLIQYQNSFDDELSNEETRLNIDLNTRLAPLRQRNEAIRVECVQLRCDLKSAQLNLSEHQKRVRKRDCDLVELDSKLKQLEVLEAEFRVGDEENEQQLVESDAQLVRLDQQAAQLMKETQQQQDRIKSLDILVTPIENEHRQLNHEINKIEAEIHSKRIHILKLNSGLNAARSRRAAKNRILTCLNQQCRSKFLFNQTILYEFDQIVAKSSSLEVDSDKQLIVKSLMSLNKRVNLNIRSESNALHSMEKRFRCTKSPRLYFKYVRKLKAKKNFANELTISELIRMQQLFTQVYLNVLNNSKA